MPLERLRQPGERIDVIHFCRLQKGGDGSGRWLKKGLLRIYICRNVLCDGGACLNKKMNHQDDASDSESPREGGRYQAKENVLFRRAVLAGLTVRSDFSVARLIPEKEPDLQI